MKKLRMAIGMCAMLTLAACGVPRGALYLAKVEAATQPAADTDLAAALRREADQWKQLDGLMGQSALGGILFVDADFKTLVHRTAAASARLRALIDAGTDDPALRREEMEAYQKLWGEVRGYLEK